MYLARHFHPVQVDVERVVGMVAGSSAEEDLKAAEASVLPVLQSLTSAMSFVTARLQNAQGTLKADLTAMQERGKESKQKLDDFRASLKQQMEQLQLQNMLQHGLKRTTEAEELLAATTQASLWVKTREGLFDRLTEVHVLRLRPHSQG